MTEDGIFWRSQTMLRLDLALSNSGVEASTPRRVPANLRSAARYCRELALRRDAGLVANLMIVAEELDAEAVEREMAIEDPLRLIRA